MIKYKRWICSVLLFSLIFIFINERIIFAQSSTNYRIKKSVLDQSGAASQSTNYNAFDATGQPVAVGTAVSSNYQFASGFFATGKLINQLPENWSFMVNTGNNATVILPASANLNINGTPLASGSYVGVFTPDGLCCGWKQWQGKNLSITVWGDDEQTIEVDGFRTGEAIGYRVYQLGEQQDWTVTVEYSQGDGLYVVNGFMVLSRFDVNITAVNNNLKLSQIPKRFQLHQNYPNPFNPSTQIRFAVPTSGVVKIDVFNMQGQKVETLVNDRYSAGVYEVQFRAKNLASGLYFYRLTAGKFTNVQKMMLLK